MRQPLLREQQKGYQPVKWLFAICGLTLLCGGLFKMQRTDFNPEEAVGSEVIPEVAPVSMQPANANFDEATVGGINADVLANLADAKKQAQFHKVLAGAESDAILAALKKGADEFTDIAKPPDWDKLLTDEMISPYLMTHLFEPTTNVDLMLWSGDWRINEAWEKEKRVYRLETTPLGAALGEIVGNANFKDTPEYIACMGTMYDRVSKVLTSSFKQNRAVLGVSEKLSAQQFKEKTLGSKEFPELMSNPTITKIEVYFRKWPSNDPGEYIGNTPAGIFSRDAGKKWDKDPKQFIVDHLTQNGCKANCNKDKKPMQLEQYANPIIFQNLVQFKCIPPHCPPKIDIHAEE